MKYSDNSRKLWNMKLTFRLELIIHTAENGPSAGFKSKHLNFFFGIYQYLLLLLSQISGSAN